MGKLALVGGTLFLWQGLSYGASCNSRSVYLNGVDISGSHNQQLKKVDVHINEKGDVYITAPHYQVYEEDHYLPISKYLKGEASPVVHKDYGPLLAPKTKEGGGLEPAPLASPSQGLLEAKSTASEAKEISADPQAPAQTLPFSYPSEASEALPASEPLEKAGAKEPAVPAP